MPEMKLGRPVKGLVTILMCSAAFTASAAHAQEQSPEADSGGLVDIVVTAQKKSQAERAQDVPIAMTVLNGEQLASGHVRNLEDLAVTAPNVSLESGGTFKGVAAFTIRGLGVNSSIASVEPTVGVFVDGIYLGTNYGVVLDNFDLEAVEILRGPQGTLQGRNVTGGAVLIRTRRPGNDLKLRAQFGVETGSQITAAASIEGAIVPDQLKAKIAVYRRHDQGWFKNSFDNSEVGEDTTWFVRPTLVWSPVDELEWTLTYERGRTRGDGVVPQSFPRLTGFDVNYNERGYSNVDWQSFTSQTDYRVAFGDGVITNLFGWRRVKQDSLTDVDAQPVTAFHGFVYLDQHQYSNEVRYAGRFADRFDVTTGLYFFRQNYLGIERRLLSGGLDRAFGGKIGQKSFGAFFQSDIDITSNVELTLGLRYSTERKSALIAAFNRPPLIQPCNYATKTCSSFSFFDSKRWDAWTPKVGLSWKPQDNLLAYASWSKGVRSGGYNLRSTDPTVAPGPYDQEDQNAYEVGLKSDLFGRTVRFNVAAFLSQIKDLQRDVNTPGAAGVVQVIRNTVDANIYGFEADLTVAPTDALQLTASVGYTDSDYKRVRFDLNNDRVINALDFALKPPRLSKWSASVGATYTIDLANDHKLTAHADYGYRSSAAGNDANTSFLTPVNMLNADLTYTFPDDRLAISLYGENLLNSDIEGGKTAVGGGVFFRPLDKGRVYGASARLSF